MTAKGASRTTSRRRLSGRLSIRRRQALLLEFEKWGFDNRRWATQTRVNYTGIVARADNWMSEHRGKALARATHKDLMAFLLSRPRSARYRNTCRNALTAFFKFLTEEGYVDTNVALGIPRVKEPRSLPKPFTHEEVQSMIGVCPEMGSIVMLRHGGAMLLALVLLMVFGGMRRHEVQKLEWAQLADKGWIRFTGKGDQDRVLPVHPRVQDALDAWKPHCPSGQWVFPSPRYPDQPVSHQSIYSWVRKIADAAGVKGGHPHRFRHSFGTSLVEQGWDLRTVQEAMGHADPSSTAVYTLIRPARMREAVESLDFK